MQVTTHFVVPSAVVELRYSLTSWQPFHQQQHEVYLLESSGHMTTSTHFVRIQLSWHSFELSPHESCGVTLRFR